MALESDGSSVSGVYAPGIFDADAYLDVLDAEGSLLLKTAQERGPDAEIPFCPGWTVGDLVPHLGFVYRWAGALVAGALPDPPPREAYFDPEPADPLGALERTAQAHAALVRILRAPVDLGCWTIWKADLAPREFWIRRMVHETLVHRVDAENGGRTPAGGEGYDVALATDGVDEIVCGFASRYSKRLRSEHPMSIAIHSTDSELSWWVRISADAPLFGRGLSPFGADVEVAGLAGELYLFLWNRRTTDGLRVVGNPEPLAAWARDAHL